MNEKAKQQIQVGKKVKTMLGMGYSRPEIVKILKSGSIQEFIDLDVKKKED